MYRHCMKSVIKKTEPSLLSPNRRVRSCICRKTDCYGYHQIRIIQKLLLVPFIKATQDRVVLRSSVAVSADAVSVRQVCSTVRPRERDVEFLKQKKPLKMLDATGHEEISLSSLSSSDYSQLPELVNFLMEECDRRGVNISLHLFELMRSPWML